MRLSEALKLKPGDIITFGDHMYGARCSTFWQGKVLRVTPRGGDRVRVIDEKPWVGPRRYADRHGSPEMWIPYVWVI